MNGTEMTLLLDLGLIVVFAAVLAFLGKVIKMPSIVAYIIAGMLLGPITGLVEMHDSLGLLSEMGIALLLFLVGLELSLQKIKDLGRVALTLGGLQVLFTSLGGFTIALLLFLWPGDATPAEDGGGIGELIDLPDIDGGAVVLAWEPFRLKSPYFVSNPTFDT